MCTHIYIYAHIGPATGQTTEKQIPPAFGVRWFRVRHLSHSSNPFPGGVYPSPISPPRGPNMVVRMVVGPSPRGTTNL